MVSRECPQKSVESPVHQQYKYSGVGGGQGRVKGLCNLHWKIWDCKSGEELLNESIVSKENDGLGKGCYMGCVIISLAAHTQV